jgi:transcriptional regulator with XRE-family HTH domain
MRFMNNIGPQVRRIREARGWTQDEFAAKLQIAGFDTTRVGVSKIENRYVFVNDKKLVYLAETLKVPVQDLFPPRQQGRLRDFMEKLDRTCF